jgi:hypothetical protein
MESHEHQASARDLERVERRTEANQRSMNPMSEREVRFQALPYP